MLRGRSRRIRSNGSMPCESSFCFDDRRYPVLAVKNRRAGYVHAKPEREITRRRRKPVRRMTCRSVVLEVNIDGAVGIRHETGAVADVVAMDRIWHVVTF